MFTQGLGNRKFLFLVFYSLCASLAYNCQSSAGGQSEYTMAANYLPNELVRGYLAGLQKSSRVIFTNFGDTKILLEDGVETAIPKSFNWTEPAPTTILMPVDIDYGRMVWVRPENVNHCLLISIQVSTCKFSLYDTLRKRPSIHEERKLKRLGTSFKSMGFRPLGQHKGLRYLKSKIRSLLSEYVDFLPPPTPFSEVVLER